MCHLISWIEKDGGLLYLTAAQVYHTKRGKALQKYVHNSDDLTGHGAIRWYYSKDDTPLTGGADKEQTDFSTPKNFPAEIAAAIKRNAFNGLPTDTAVPLKGLLTATAQKKYCADRKSLNDKYYADLKPLNDKYCADRKPLDDLYYADLKSLNDKYYADRDNLFWDLFAVKRNRPKCWR